MCNPRFIRFFRCNTWLLALVFTLLLVASGCSDDDDPAGPGGTDSLLGTWTYSTSGGWSSGFPRPIPSETSGTVTLTTDGGNVALTIDSGFVCDPAFSCFFAGSISGDTIRG